MNRTVVLIITLLSSLIANSQPKKISGVDYSTIQTDNFIVSKDARFLAIDRINGDYLVLDADSLTLLPFNTGKAFSGGLAKHLTPDFAGGYGTTAISYSNEFGAKYFLSYITRAGSDKPKLFYSDSIMILGVGDGKMFVTNIWPVKTTSYGREIHVIGGYAGLWTADPLTGRKMKQLRSDTMYRNKAETVYHPDINLNEYELFLRDEYAYDKMTRIFPFGKDTVLTKFLPGASFRYAAQPGFCPDINGQKNTFCCNDCEFTVVNHTIYRINRANLSVTEFEREGNELKEVKEYAVSRNGDEGVELDNRQIYKFVLLKGPSLAIIPISDKENEYAKDNVGFLVDLSTGKVKLKIAPFFYRNAEAKLRAIQVAGENMEYAKKQREACDSLVISKRLKTGCTYNHNTDGLIIFKGMDCETNKFRFWKPMEFFGSAFEPGKYILYTLSWLSVTESKKQYMICSECEGSGHIGYIEYTTKTKDLPWGYFDGIDTKKITTTQTKKYKVCSVCRGQGIALK